MNASPDTQILPRCTVWLRWLAVMGCACVLSGAFTGCDTAEPSVPDGSVRPDAGEPQPMDGGAAADAGREEDAGGPDAMVPRDDGGTAAGDGGAASDAGTPDASAGDAGAAEETDAGSGGGLEDVLSRSLFASMFLHQDESVCNASVYTYDALVEAARRFPAFGAVGSAEIRRREVAAFLANISHETTGGWPTAPDGPFAWGLCFREEIGCGETPSPCEATYCDLGSTTYPCAAGQSYHGRGPIQLSWNYNYGQAGTALGLPLLSEPGRLTADGVTGWLTALWFWMTPQAPKPSCHEVMIGTWEPSAEDRTRGRLPGFGLTVNIINGGLECGPGRTDDYRVLDRIGFFERYAGLMDTTVGDNLTCDTMTPY